MKEYYKILIGFGILLIFLIVIVIYQLTPNNKDIHLKDFLFQHPEVKLQVNNKGTIYNKYSSRKELNRLHSKCRNEILIISIAKEVYEIIPSSEFQKIGKSSYYIKLGGFVWRTLVFQVLESKKEVKELSKNEVKKDVKQIKNQNKEELHMSLSLGTWILLIIVMIIVAKLAHKFNLKTIFRPAKKTVQHVEKEWKDS